MVLVLIIFLLAAALNISNEAINQLTGEERKAMADVHIDDRNINLMLMGEEYQVSDPLETSRQLFDCCCSSIRNHLLSIWIIFRAVF